MTHTTALDNNLSSQQQITPYSADFPSLSSTDSDFELTLTLIIITDLLSVPRTRIDSVLFWIVKCEISVVYIVYTCKESKIKLHQSTAASTWWCGPQPRLSWVKMAVGFPEGPSYLGQSPHTNHFFTVKPPERPQKGSTQPL